MFSKYRKIFLITATLMIAIYAGFYFVQILVAQQRQLAELSALLDESRNEHKKTIKMINTKFINQQEEIEAIESNFKSSLLKLQLQEKDPASEELIHALLAAHHDSQLFLEVQLAEYLVQDRAQDALALLAQAQTLTQSQKLKLASFIKNRKTWSQFQDSLAVESKNSTESNSPSYLAALGISIQRPADPTEEFFEKLRILLEARNYQTVCQLRPWEGLGEHNRAALDDLCNPLPRITQQLATHKG